MSTRNKALSRFNGFISLINQGDFKYSLFSIASSQVHFQTTRQSNEVLQKITSNVEK